MSVSFFRESSLPLHGQLVLTGQVSKNTICSPSGNLSHFLLKKKPSLPRIGLASDT